MTGTLLVLCVFLLPKIPQWHAVHPATGLAPPALALLLTIALHVLGAMRLCKLSRTAHTPTSATIPVVVPRTRLFIATALLIAWVLEQTNVLAAVMVGSTAWPTPVQKDFAPRVGPAAQYVIKVRATLGFVELPRPNTITMQGGPYVIHHSPFTRYLPTLACQPFALDCTAGTVATNLDCLNDQENASSTISGCTDSCPANCETCTSST